ncbi:MAG: hypothetical protein ACFFCM_02050 [Promethearchaeota archaeon]
MTKNKIYYILFASLIASVLLLIPIQGVRAIGPSFESGPDGFDVTINDVLIYNFTAADPVFYQGGQTVGDLFRITVTTKNNFNFGGWIADYIWIKLEYFNHTSGKWSVPIPETILAGYNSTVPYSAQYYFQTQEIPAFIPLNFSAANYTLVEMSIEMDNLENPMHISPIPPDINGTWSIWNGSWSTPNSYMYNYSFSNETFNNDIILTQMAYLVNGTTGWHTYFELTLVDFYIPKFETDLRPFLFALVMTAVAGGAFGPEIIMVIAIVSVIVVIVVIVIIKQIRE